MQTYVVRRPSIAADAAALAAALARLRAFELESTSAPVRWQLSCALREPDGRLGLACVFQADGEDALRRHARRLQLPATEILPVAATLLARAMAPSRVYLVRRRGAWADAAALERAAAASRRVSDEEMPTRVCWLRSYAVREADGSLGSWCLFQGVDAAALAEHARRAALPADEITPVLGWHMWRDDAAPAAPAQMPPP